MGAIGDLVGRLFGKLNEHQRQRIEDAVHLLEKATREVARLEAENERLRTRVAVMRERLRAYEERERERSEDLDPATGG